MYDSKMANRPSLEMRWLPVTDERGHTRMEAVWVEAPTAATADHAA